MAKQGTVFPWVGNGKSISTALRIFIALAAILIPSIIFFGNAYWFSKEKGEAIEKKQDALEQTLEHRHELHLIEQKHTNEKLDEFKQHTDEQLSELKQIILRSQ